MTKKLVENQSVTRRVPRQGRAQVKVELILEAATRIIDKEGLEGLSTNRIAEVAGISIGTLYQYFPNKKEVLAALGQRELAAVMAQIVMALSVPNTDSLTDQARVLIHAVFGAFGGRTRVHRVLLDAALAQGKLSLLERSPNLIADMLAANGAKGLDGQSRRLSAAEAFVLTHAFVGVTRAAVGVAAESLKREDIEAALLALIQSFLGESGGAGRTQGL